MRILDISREYTIANRMVLAIIILLLALPFAVIFAEQHNSSLLSSNTLNCFVKTHTGELCPTCGLSRSIILLYKGHFKESIIQHKYGYILILLLSVQLVIKIILCFRNNALYPYIDIAQMIFCGMIWLSLTNQT